MNAKNLIKLSLTGLLALSLTACSSNQQASATATPESTATPVSGTVSASGSSALLPLVQAAADDFMTINPDCSVTPNGGGSGTGLKQVADGSVDIGNSDVFAEEKLDATQAAKLVDHKVAVVVVAPVVNKSLGVTNLTSAQLVDIFTGKITNWKEVGGKDLDIMLVTRPSSSGTRALFKKWAMNGAEESDSSSLETDDSGTLMQTITDNEGAIGYVALSYLTNNTKATAVSIDGNEATLENTYSGKYNVWGFEHMYTNGEATGAVDAFLQFIVGDTFAEKIESMGYGVASKMSDTAVSSHN